MTEVESKPNIKNKAEEQNSPSKKVKVEVEVDGDNLDIKYEKIKNQLEYYFSDVNIVQDKFMLNEIEKSDGWIDISKLLTFSRLKSLTSSSDEIVTALSKNESSLIELDNEKKKIHRKTPLPDIDEYIKATHERSIHLSGFPTDYTFEQLKTFCELHGEVESVMMRHNFKTRAFKGNINVVFKDAESVKKIMEVDEFKCKDRVIRREAMDAYLKRKEEFKKSLIEKKKKNK